jgi:Arylsulfotransferase (ASST)
VSQAEPRRLRRGAFLTGAAGIAAAAVLGDRLLASGTRNPKHAKGGFHKFVSRPDLKPPKITVVRRAGPTAAGLLFLAPSSGPGQRGPLIADDSGEPIWCLPTNPDTVTNLRVALYKGEPVLTWWEGKTKHGLGIGEHVIYDRSYREIARFPAGNGLGADLHELFLTPQGTALVAAWDIQTVDRSSVGHGRGRVIEGVAQELEIPSARVLFEWRSLDHVALTESYAQVAPAFDFFHINAIDYDSDGNLLISSRNCWTVYKVDRGSGKVIWRLGGKKSDFTIGPGAHFSWQHDARHHGANDGMISLYDNADNPQEEPQSRGVILRLDTKGKHATLASQYLHVPKQLAHIFGSVQTQPNGNVLVGFGASPYFTEYTMEGKVVYDAKLPYGGENYRTLRFPWVGAPTDKPSLAARGQALYASWNGATAVHSWHVLGGSSAGSLTSRVTVPRSGFETRIPLATLPAYAAVVAFDKSGKTLGTSPTIQT